MSDKLAHNIAQIAVAAGLNRTCIIWTILDNYIDIHPVGLMPTYSMRHHFNLSQLSARHKRALSLSLLIAALLYLSMAVIGGYDNFILLVEKLGITGWLLLLGCSTGNYLIRFVRWNYFLRRIGYYLPHKLHILYYLAGFALTTTPGKAGETIRSFYLRSHGVNFPHSLATFFIERFLDVLVVTFFAALAILSFSQYKYFVFIILIVLLLAVTLIRSNLTVRLLQYLIFKISSARLKSALTHLCHLLITAADLLKLRSLYTGLTAGVLAWGLQGLAFIYLLHVFDIDLSYHLALSIYAISLLAGAASFIPGGIGATEAVMSLLLISQGVDKSVALSVPIITRIGTLWYAVMLGLLSTAWLGYINPSVNPSVNANVNPNVNPDAIPSDTQARQ